MTDRRAAYPPPETDVLVVHASDVHIEQGYVAAAYEGDRMAGLRCVLAAARDAGADVTVLAGDTFDTNNVPLDLVHGAVALLADAGMPVVILPGNHDPATADSVFRRGGLADLPNVHILGVTHEAAVMFPRLRLEVWGHAHFDYSDMVPLRTPRPRTSFWQIILAHGHYQPVADRSTRLRPSWLLDDEEIAATGADYIALGHWNRNATVGDGRVAAHYSGSPDLARSVNLVRLAASGSVTVTRLPLPFPPEAQDA